jgi:integrase
MSDIDLERRMVIPNAKSTTTKQRWISFFNEECEQALREYSASRRDVASDSQLFPITSEHIARIFRIASRVSEVKITPQVLREWFACEMGALNVPDRFVDAFCGRVPRSVLARHYTDYSPERLKAIYDRAGLKVLV